MGRVCHVHVPWELAHSGSRLRSTIRLTILKKKIHLTPKKNNKIHWCVAKQQHHVSYIFHIYLMMSIFNVNI